MVNTIFDNFGISSRICIIYSYRCNFKCSHCIMNCSINRTETIPLQRAKEILEVSKEFGKNYVIFSGGEIFLFYDDLLSLSQTSYENGYNFGIETNGFWASDREKTARYLNPLVERNLKSVYLSIDAYHLPFSNLDYQLNIIEYCKLHNLDYEVSFTPFGSKEQDDPLLLFFKQHDIHFNIEPLLNLGRGKYLSSQSPNQYHISQLKFCDSFCTTFLPNGDMFACCDITDTNEKLKNTPMYYGNINEKDIRTLYNQCNIEILKKLYDENNPNNFRNLEKFPQMQSIANNTYENICDFCIHFFNNNEICELYKKIIE